MSDPATRDASARQQADATPVPEPTRRAERTAGVLLVAFAVLTFLVRDHWGPVVRFDDSLGAAATRWSARHETVADLAHVVSAAGAFPTRTVLVVILAVLLATRGHRRGAWFVVLVTAGGALLNLAVKSLVDRPRPVVADPIATANGFSFPSGHAMGAAVFAALVVSVLLFSGVVEARTRWWIVAVIAAALLIGASRVVLGVHYASDVVGGWALGVAWVALATAVVRPWRT